ncbi:MAG: Yae1 family protein [Planctomycetales bacterium]|nr:Yae1 family protein [Planctomycetales bacterium]MCA9168804.1 Yae1 family protein [Planctomycetales bacterium]
MSTLIAMIVIVVALGMLVAYQLGYAVGRREGFDDGFNSGKKKGAVKAYAVGYDRGRHDREAKAAEENPAEPQPTWRDQLSRWLLPAILSVIVILLAAVFAAKDLRSTDRDFERPSSPAKLGFE